MKAISIPTLALLALGLVGGLACCSQGGRSLATSVDGMQVMNVLTEGAISGVRDQRVVIVRSEAEWDELWLEHTRTELPRTTRPEVDFDQNMIVAVFLGDRPTAGYSVAVEDCLQLDDVIEVQALEWVPDADTAQAQVVTAPFRMVVLPNEPGEGRLQLSLAKEDLTER